MIYKRTLVLCVVTVLAIGSMLLPVCAAPDPSEENTTTSSVTVAFTGKPAQPKEDEVSETPVPPDSGDPSGSSDPELPGGTQVSRPGGSDNSGGSSSSDNTRTGNSSGSDVQDKDTSLPFESYKQVDTDLVYVMEPPVPTQHLGELPKTGSDRRIATLLSLAGLSLITIALLEARQRKTSTQPD